MPESDKQNRLSDEERLSRYVAASRTHPGLRSMLMYEWKQSTRERGNDEEC